MADRPLMTGLFPDRNSASDSDSDSASASASAKQG